MGIGDDLIWLGDAYNRYTSTGRAVKPTRRRRPLEIKPLWQQEAYVSKQGTETLDELIPYNNDWRRPYAVNDPDYMPSNTPYTNT